MPAHVRRRRFGQPAAVFERDKRWLSGAHRRNADHRDGERGQVEERTFLVGNEVAVAQVLELRHRLLHGRDRTAREHRPLEAVPTPEIGTPQATYQVEHDGAGGRVHLLVHVAKAEPMTGVGIERRRQQMRLHRERDRAIRAFDELLIHDLEGGLRGVVEHAIEPAAELGSHEVKAREREARTSGR